MANANYSVDDAVILIGVVDSEGDAKRANNFHRATQKSAVISLLAAAKQK